MYDRKPKINDTIKLKPYRDEFDEDFLGCNNYMKPFFGKTVTVTGYIKYCEGFCILEDNGEWNWSFNWIEPIPINTLPEELFTI